MNDAMMLACTLSRWEGDLACCRWCNTALEGRRQRWCSDECADDAVGNHWWNVARSRALARDGWRCVRCGPNARPHGVGRGGLQVHHRDDQAHGRHAKTSCCHHVDGLETLCGHHHRDEHRRERHAQPPSQMRIGDAA